MLQVFFRYSTFAYYMQHVCINSTAYRPCVNSAISEKKEKPFRSSIFKTCDHTVSRSSTILGVAILSQRQFLRSHNFRRAFSFHTGGFPRDFHLISSLNGWEREGRTKRTTRPRECGFLQGKSVGPASGFHENLHDQSSRSVSIQLWCRWTAARS